MREELIKIDYKVEKNKEDDKWMVVRYSESKRGYSVGKIFEGTRKECFDKLKEVKQ